MPNRQGEHWLYLPVQLSMNRLTKHGQINAIQSVVFTCNQMNKTNNSLLAVSEDPIQTDDSSTKTQCQQLITQAFLWQQISYSQGMGKLYIEANSAKTKRNSCTVCVCVCYNAVNMSCVMIVAVGQCWVSVGSVLGQCWVRVGSVLG